MELRKDIDRLGLAYCRLNTYEWDEILGPKPDGFDNLPKWAKKKWPFSKKKRTKSDYVRPAMRAIERIIGETNCSRCWWVYGLGRTEEEWFRWYIRESIKADS